MMEAEKYTVHHIGRSTRQDGPDWTPKERAMDETKAPERIWACDGHYVEANPHNRFMEEYVRADLIADHRRLVRKIDGIMHGDKAALQASLCDLVGPIATLTAERDAAQSMERTAVECAEQANIALEEAIAERDAPAARVKALETAEVDMRERAAKVCDDIESDRWLMWKTYYDMMDQGRSDGACDCAAAIRALPLTGSAS